MNTIVMTIDTLYERIVRISVRLLEHIYDAFSFKAPPATLETGLELLESDIESILIEEDVLDGPKTFKTIDEVLRSKVPTKTQSATVPAATKNVVMYTSSMDVPVYTNPTIEFDTKISSIPYGEMVMMVDMKGRFYQIAWNELKGWVLKEDIVDRAADIHPELIIGVENEGDSPNTTHIRAMLGDPFGVGRADFPLQSGEYVLYKLWEKEHHIEWPDTRPRTPGLWHKILRGVPRVHIGVMPKVGSIMEFIHEDDYGHLAYVDAVFPDNTISISEANYPDAGRYNERIFTKEEWKELRPVFIQVH